MDNLIVRYQINPMLTDTVGFFDYCIPLTNESIHPVADSLRKYYDYSVYNYVTPPPTAKEIHRTTSIFIPNNLSPIHSGPLPVNKQSTDWITLLLLVCLFIIAWIQTFYSKRLSQIFRAAALPHAVNQLEREGDLFRQRISLGLGFIYYTVGSIFIFQIYSAYNVIHFGKSNLLITAGIFVGLFLYQIIKSLMIYILGYVFDNRESARAYQLNTLIFNHITGLFLFPVTIIAFYWESIEILNIGIIIVLLLTLYGLYRGILTGLSDKNYNLFYLFLYLCTLEILPLLLIYKVISKI
jgi:hypothetical protein